MKKRRPPQGAISHAEPGRGSTREEAQKADIEALRFLDQIWNLNRKGIEDYARAHPPSVEVIAAIAFVTIRARRAMIRELNVNGISELLALRDTNVVAKYLFDTNSYEQLTSDISKVKADRKEKNLP